MKKIFLMACTAFLLVSCGTGNKYADEYISACKDAAGTYEATRMQPTSRN